VRKLRAIARQERISVAEAVRRCVTTALVQVRPDREALYARAARLVGKFRDRSQATDLSAEHDRYLERALR